MTPRGVDSAFMDKGSINRPSAFPFPGRDDLTPGGIPQGFNGPSGHVDVATQDTAVFVREDGSVDTRFKYGPADVGGDTSIDGGGA